MGAEDSEPELPPSVFFTYRLEDREEHLSPQEVMAASELGRHYPFLGSNGVPQHINHASETLLMRPVLREKSENCRVTTSGKENLQPARGGRRDLAGVHKPSRRREVAAADDDNEGKHLDNNQQVGTRDFCGISTLPPVLGGTNFCFF